MRTSLRLWLCGAALVVASPVFAAESPGLVQGDHLKNLTKPLWDDMSLTEITDSIGQLPDDTGSRALNQLVKAALLAPITLPGAEKEEPKDGEEKTVDAHSVEAETITALRLQKLMEMGGLNEAKKLVDLIDSETITSPELKEQVLLALVASNTKQAACIDLLAYQSEEPEDFEKLSAGPKAVLADCLKTSAAKAAAKKDYSLAELKDLGPWESALTIAGDLFAIKAEGNVSADYAALSPFQQSLIMQSAGISPRLQWRLMGPALKHDYVTVTQAQDIYNRADLAKDLSATDVRKLVSAKPGFERLPSYYKALSSDKGAHPEMPKDLATPIAAAGITYDVYALLPFQPYLTQLDMSSLSVRSAFINTLAIYMDGGSLADINQKPKPSDSAWVFSVLNGEQEATPADADMWASKNLDLLSGMAPELESKLVQRLQDIVAEDGNKSGLLTDYVNKKSLTPEGNYVMHDDTLLKEAESLGSEGAVGPMLVQLALAGRKTNPGRLDPEGMMRMNRLLEKTGLTATAHKLFAEGLVFRMAPKTSSMGNNS